MKKTIVKTDNYLLVVDNSEIKIWYYDEYSKKVHHSGGAEYSRNDITKNIVAHLPLNGYGILEGVPLLPPLEVEDDVQNLAKDYLLNDYQHHFNVKTNDEQFGVLKGYVNGFNKAREKYKFTEEDMINFACKVYNENYDKDDSFFTTAKTLIESFSQPKTPTHFEFEMERGDLPYYVIKTTTNSQGQEVACGKYIYAS